MSAPRHDNVGQQEFFELAYDHVAVTATTTVKLARVPVGKKLRIDKVEYVNVTGLAEHADNHFDIAIELGGTVAANWSTDDVDEGTIAADTFVDLTLSATDANLVADASAAVVAVNLVLTETGTATLPAGRIVVWARYV